MRPKFVLVIMLLAVGALGLLVALKRIHEGRGGAQDVPADSSHVEAMPLPETEGASVTSGLGSGVSPVVSSATDGRANPSTNNLVVQSGPVPTSIVATTPEEDHRAAIEKDMDKLNEALIDGGSDPKLVEAVRQRLLHPDADVRKAAVEIIMHLNDRAAIPNLNAALAQVQDPREKVVIMDAIEYLQTPDGDLQFTTDTPPPGPLATGATNRFTIQRPTVRQPTVTGH
jgi:hypothetical protein